MQSEHRIVFRAVLCMFSLIMLINSSMGIKVTLLTPTAVQHQRYVLPSGFEKISCKLNLVLWTSQLCPTSYIHTWHAIHAYVWSLTLLLFTIKSVSQTLRIADILQRPKICPARAHHSRQWDLRDRQRCNRATMWSNVHLDVHCLQVWGTSFGKGSECFSRVSECAVLRLSISSSIQFYTRKFLMIFILELIHSSEC